MGISLSRRKFTAMVLASAPSWLGAQVPAPPAMAGRKLDFRIDDGFNAGESDIRAVLLSAGESLWKHCPHTRWEVPGFRIYYNEKNPIAEFKHRPDGRIGIGLNTQGNHWSQFAYQFAHEFCHALAGHSNDWTKLWIGGNKANHWLEESLCETASLFALRAMGESWQTAPPFPNWKSYAGHLTEYATKRMADTAANLSEGTMFSDWFLENEPSLRETSTLREKNNVVARQLLPLFEAQPSGWESITSYNRTKCEPVLSLAGQFTVWRAAAPPLQHAFISKVAAVFGVRVG